jgi:hypothetical protein
MKIPALCLSSTAVVPALPAFVERRRTPGCLGEAVYLQEGRRPNEELLFSRAQLSPGQVCGFPSPHPDQGLIRLALPTDLTAVVTRSLLPACVVLAGRNCRLLRTKQQRGEFSPNGSQSGYSARVV